MGPFSVPDGGYLARSVDEVVPGLAAEVDDLRFGMEDDVGEPVVAQVLPDVLDRIEFWRARRQRDEGDVVGELQLVRGVPAGLIQEQKGVRADLDLRGDLVQMALHGLGVATWLHECGAGAAFGTDGAEDVGRLGALIVGCAWPGAAPGPASGDLVLLPDPGFILPPDFYLRAVGEAVAEPRDQLGEFFLKSSMTPSSWA